MAYIALYRKWRPKSFSDVVGQKQVTEILQKAICLDKIAHAYLFSGPRGTGKTSMAKIFARAINCEHEQNGNPCNTCSICTQIIEGDSLDVVEIDAASNRSIEDIRTLRETIKFLPAEGRKKIYIIDEVHMLTIEAFNALLKTLEEPPSHVIFILATTEPERIPITILSRCQRYEFHRISSDDIMSRLLYIAKEENISLTVEAARLLAVQAEGGMRDALSMLDQCVGNGTQYIDDNMVRQVLGLLGKEWIFSLSTAIFHNQGKEIIKQIDNIIHLGKEPYIILSSFIEHIRALMFMQVHATSDVMADYAEQMQELEKQAQSITSERLFYILKVLQETLLQVKTSPMPRVIVEMGLLMAAQGENKNTNISDSALALQVNQLENMVLQLQTKVDTLIKNKPIITSVTSNIPEDKDEIDDYEEDYTVVSEIDVPCSQDNIKEAHTKEAKEAVVLSEKVVSTGNITNKTTSEKKEKLYSSIEYEEIFQQVLRYLNDKKKKRIAYAFGQGKIVCIEKNTIVISLNDKFSFGFNLLKEENARKMLEEAFGSILQVTCYVQVYLDSDSQIKVWEKKSTALLKKNNDNVQKKEVFHQKKETLAAVVSATHVHMDNTETNTVLDAQVNDVKKMNLKEKSVVEPLLKRLGECNIYIEEDPYKGEHE
ncbi:DNA polymerase III subunit gamma/tau [uncultured Megasphaera sp.]|uniref:DNA polymerase III subunit gamma/tau n=1 Tax=uncultured Megasphaera sp. TaxID=165188 RepID=UPI00259B64E8|nr:DNA polymerase III subunit gamma/tau [uncultured Megasphaera sp.]